MNTPAEDWPALPLADWRDTRDTLHLWTQVVGKVRLGLAPFVNHWWQVTLYPTARGLTTSAMPCGRGTLEIRFDFLGHALVFETSAGDARRIALEPRTVADFYFEVIRTLRDLGIDVRVWPHPVERADAIPFPEDTVHHAYDAEAAERFWRALLRATDALQDFRGGFTGKCSPVHFWWGSFDLACTRFSGRRAPPHPGGVPHLADWVTREAYSHECWSAGWWPGDTASGAEAAFYAYAYPEPEGFGAWPAKPADARYDATLHEFLLPYDAVRRSADPATMVQAFLASTYDAAATLGAWDRDALESTMTRHA
jgi:hypothetical protein